MVLNKNDYKGRVFNKQVKLSFKQKIQSKLTNLIKIIINIDIDFIFLFMATYLFLFNLEWYIRLIGSIGTIYIYKRLKNDILQILMRLKIMSK